MRTSKRFWTKLTGWNAQDSSALKNKVADGSETPTLGMSDGSCRRKMSEPLFDSDALQRLETS